MDSTKQNNSRKREEGDARDERLIAPESRVFGPPCPNTLDWNAAVHQQQLLSTLPSPSSHERAYTKWLQGHRMEPAWTELNFLQRAEWVQFYYDMTTEDLKVTELESEEIQDEYEAEAKEYVQMAQKTIIPLKQENQIEEDTFEPKFYQQDPGAAFNASGSNTTDAGSPSYDFKPSVPGETPQQMYYGTGHAGAGESSNVPGPVGTLRWPRTQELIQQERGSKKRKLPPSARTMYQQSAGQSGQFGPPMSQPLVVQSPPSMTQAPVYNQFGPPPQSAPSMSQPAVYNQFPATGPVYLNQNRSPYNEPKKE